ncbi:pyrimidine dimer DNA glycosylase/endonuclease V [Bacteroidota bacterium]
MVRINLIEPEKLADQHLIAEYNEILMLLGYVRKYPEKKNIPENYCLGKGHISFFKDKLKYIEKRHEILKEEMKQRGFVPSKNIDLSEFNAELVNDWSPNPEDFEVIKQRLREKIIMKPDFYKYRGEQKHKDFFLGLLQ